MKRGYFTRTLDTYNLYTQVKTSNIYTEINQEFAVQAVCTFQSKKLF